MKTSAKQVSFALGWPERTVTADQSNLADHSYIMASPKVGSNSHIDIYLRVRPVKQASACLALDVSENKVEFNIPRTASQG